MTSQQSPPPQPMPAPQPVVLVVNRPMLMDPSRQPCYARQPYLNRGVQFSNGLRCSTPHISVMCSLGIFILFIGFSTVTMGIFIGVPLLVIGGALLGLALYFIRTAKKQFNNLPADHPDRTKYTSPYFTPIVSRGPAGYAVPPMQNQVMTYPTASGGQVYFMPVPAGSYVPTSSGLNGGQVQFVAQPGHRSPHGTYVPENDPPPAYTDVVHNI